MRNATTLFILCVLLLVSCKTTKEVTPTRTTDSICIERLAPYAVEPDSTLVSALLECNKEGKVMMRNLQTANSKNAELSFALDSVGKLDVKTVVNHDTIYMKSDSIVIKTTTKEYIEVPTKLTKWQSWKIKVGGWVTALLALGFISAVVYAVLKVKKIIM